MGVCFAWQYHDENRFNLLIVESFILVFYVCVCVFNTYVCKSFVGAIDNEHIDLMFLF